MASTWCPCKLPFCHYYMYLSSPLPSPPLPSPPLPSSPSPLLSLSLSFSPHSLPSPPLPPLIMPPQAWELHDHEDDAGTGHAHAHGKSVEDFLWKGSVSLLAVYVFYLLEYVLHSWSSHTHSHVRPAMPTYLIPAPPTEEPHPLTSKTSHSH